MQNVHCNIRRSGVPPGQAEFFWAAGRRTAVIAWPQAAGRSDRHEPLAVNASV